MRLIGLAILAASLVLALRAVGAQQALRELDEELSRSLLNLAERDGGASYLQFTARRRAPT